MSYDTEGLLNQKQPLDEPNTITRQEFLKGAMGWSAIVAALVAGSLANPAPAEAGGWVNRRGGGGGWVNGGGGGWINGGGGGGGWINGGGGGWVNRRGGGSWVNRR